MKTFDLLVIGAGPGGYPAAIRAAQRGASVAVIEREALGGTCLNWGCIPTKTLIASASLYHRIRRADALGVTVSGCGFDYGAMVRRKDQVVERLKGGVEQLLKANGVRVFRGAASFLARDRVAVAGEAGDELTAKGVIIATGAASVVPGFLPRHERIVESRRFLELTTLPARLIVLGGGVIGCEFACLAAQLGVEVTLVEMLPDILAPLDADVRRELRRSMEKTLGITILAGSPLEDIRADASGVAGRVNGRPVAAEMLLVSVGRKPVTAGLDLARAGVATTPAGQIEIDAGCRTSAAGIFAVGDVTAGSLQLAHAATAQGLAAAEDACGTPRGSAAALVPACIFTEPEIGVVGLTEDKARETGVEVRVGKFLLGGLGKSLAAGEAGGFVKWIAAAHSDRLVGAQAVGPHATELIAEAVVAIRSGLTAGELGRIIHCHPTFGEAWMEAAHAVHGECIHAAPRRKTI
jgi:dihydrolipoamide dehydrogenase